MIGRELIHTTITSVHEINLYLLLSNTLSHISGKINLLAAKGCGQARIMVVVGRRQNFFRRPFSKQICKKILFI